MTAIPVCNAISEAPDVARCSFELSQHAVHIWTLRTIASDSRTAELEQLLAEDERARAARFRFEHLRRSFMLTRGVLRCLLGRYLQCRPDSIGFNYGSKGKPSVDSAAGLMFNTTHSGGLAAFAFTLGCEIGLDLEHVRPIKDAQSIANHFFCPEEAAEIMSLSPSERDAGFFRCWTRKEAYIKAIGDGLSAPLDDFRVTLQLNEPPRFIHLARNAEAAQAWTLHDLSLESTYAAALAYEDRPRSLSVFRILDPSEIL